jgi:hypothetical protein
MFSSYLLWRLWREQNERTFEDKEMTLKEFKSFLLIKKMTLSHFFFIFFSWTAAYLALLVLSFNDFFVFFSSPI